MDSRYAIKRPREVRWVNRKTPPNKHKKCAKWNGYLDEPEDQPTFHFADVTLTSWLIGSVWNVFAPCRLIVLGDSFPFACLPVYKVESAANSANVVRVCCVEITGKDVVVCLLTLEHGQFTLSVCRTRKLGLNKAYSRQNFQQCQPDFAKLIKD